MDPRYIHAFIVKLWLERREIEGAKPEWRGRIDHVQSGKRAYFRDPAQIMRFIQAYLENTEPSPPAGAEQDPGSVS
jgi:hypothetical protein